MSDEVVAAEVAAEVKVEPEVVNMEAEVIDEVKQAVVEVKPEAPTRSPIEIHNEKQGKKKTSKKKIASYSKNELLDEIQRLERGGHGHSKYYHHIKNEALSRNKVA